MGRLRLKNSFSKKGCASRQAAFLSAIMLKERRRPLVTRISWAAALCLTLSFLNASCERPAVSDSTTASTPAATTDATVAGAFLRADPNPVLSGNPNGRTTITWATGSDAVGDVYVVGTGGEKLFGSGSEGTQDAPWIPVGSTEFRLYSQPDRKLLAKLTVTMPSSDSSANRPPGTPASSASP